MLASPIGPRERCTSSVMGSPERLTESTMAINSGCTSAWFQTRPNANAPGEAFTTVLDGSMTTPADSSVSRTWSTPSGTAVLMTSAASCPRRAAKTTRTTTPAPTRRPNTKARGTSVAGSIATRLVRTWSHPDGHEHYAQPALMNVQAAATLRLLSRVSVAARTVRVSRARRIRIDTKMREVFQQELREVQERLVEIADLVAASIEPAPRAFNESNVSLAETVIADDNKIDVLALELDELAINILARQQPVARDLRIVVSALRISASLERMGDMSEHIAQLARYRFPDKVVPKSLRPTFQQMGTL